MPDVLRMVAAFAGADQWGLGIVEGKSVAAMRSGDRSINPISCGGIGTLRARVWVAWIATAEAAPRDHGVDAMRRWGGNERTGMPSAIFDVRKATSY